MEYTTHWKNFFYPPGWNWKWKRQKEKKSRNYVSRDDFICKCQDENMEKGKNGWEKLRQFFLLPNYYFLGRIGIRRMHHSCERKKKCIKMNKWGKGHTQDITRRNVSIFWDIHVNIIICIVKTQFFFKRISSFARRNAYAHNLKSLNTFVASFVTKKIVLISKLFTSTFSWEENTVFLFYSYVFSLSLFPSLWSSFNFYEMAAPGIRHEAVWQYRNKHNWKNDVNDRPVIK